MPYTLECLRSRSKSGQLRENSGAYRIGGEQLATMTFFAPTSFAIWIISLEVVPRTIESERGMSSSDSVTPRTYRQLVEHFCLRTREP